MKKTCFNMMTVKEDNQSMNKFFLAKRDHEHESSILCS